MTDVTIRPEQPADAPAVKTLLARAFRTTGEMRLVEALRDEADPYLALVAERHGQIIGHIVFTAVGVGEAPRDGRWMGLAPMAVLPEFQQRGIGSRLVREGLAACHAAGAEAVIVLGHADYYPRFGFRPAADVGLFFRDESYAPHLFALELDDDALDGLAGEVHYHPAFYEV